LLGHGERDGIWFENEISIKTAKFGKYIYLRYCSINIMWWYRLTKAVEEKTLSENHFYFLSYLLSRESLTLKVSWIGK
jgi:hypothetical protein